uniref:Putative secreted protein n=1 Tax=Anopheles marajoara TaxID=58244 RepID=A0A2M4C7Q0_9DIPT
MRHALRTGGGFVTIALALAKRWDHPPFFYFGWMKRNGRWEECTVGEINIHTHTVTIIFFAFTNQRPKRNRKPVKGFNSVIQLSISKCHPAGERTVGCWVPIRTLPKSQNTVRK